MLKQLALATLLECAMNSWTQHTHCPQPLAALPQQASQVPAAAEQAPGPAVSEQIEVWVPQWKPGWSLQEIAHFRTFDFPAWNALQTWVSQNLRESAQRTLTLHYWQSPRSLKTCGLETFLEAPAVGGRSLSYVQILLPYAFVYDDGLEIRFISLVSEELDSHMKIQEHACTELLCYLVVSGPTRVWLHPNCFYRGTQAIEEFQNKAVDFGQSVGFWNHSLAWQFPEIHTGQYRIVDHVAVLNCLRGLECNEEYYSSRIPMGIMMKLKMLLPEEYYSSRIPTQEALARGPLARAS